MMMESKKTSKADLDSVNDQTHSLEYHFAIDTTCHGLQNLVQSKTWVGRIFWTIAMAAACVILVYAITMLALTFFKFRTITNVQLVQKRPLMMPAVTMCNYNKFRKDKLLEVCHKYDIDCGYLWAMLSTIVDFNLGIFMSPVDVKDIHETEEYVASIIPVNTTAWDILEEVGYGQLEQLIDITSPDTCAWYDTILDDRNFSESKVACKQEYFTRVTTHYGFCYSFNYGESPALSQSLPGGQGGLKLRINIEQDQYTEGMAMGSPQAGVRVLLHHRNVHPNVAGTGFAVPPGTYTYVTLSYEKELYTDSYPWGSCRSSSTAFYPVYTQEACIEDCQIKNFLAKCGCKPFWDADVVKEKFPVCSAQNVTECYRNQLREVKIPDSDIAECMRSCIQACEVHNYPASVSYAQFPNVAYMNQAVRRGIVFPNETEHFEKNYLYLRIYYDSLKYIERTQLPAKSPADLLGDIGGQMGLFIGASVLTLAEFVELLVRKCRQQLSLNGNM